MERIYRVQQDGLAFHAIERDGVLRRASGDLFGGLEAGAAIPGGLADLKLLPPVMPSKLVCIGLNYKDHAAEQHKPLPAQPLFFIKPRTCVIGPGDPIKIPPGVGRVDHEAELGVVIGRRAHRVKRAEAWDYVFGLICVNDVTARDLQNKGMYYTHCKGFDTFAPIGPAIARGLDGASRRVEGWVNAERRQSSTTGQLIFDVPYLIEYISFVMTLEPGDILSTGTPAGIGPIKSGDHVKVAVEGVGELINPVEEE